MVCTGCGTVNETGRKFCKECAAPLARLCTDCGTSNASDAKFCGECATALVSATGDLTTATPAPTEPVAERRFVSVLFADLVGFTTFAEGRDAEDVREALSRYFEISREIIGRYGGTVEKFIGDAVMAVWGAPVAHEDDAERAVRAALELVDAVPRVGPGIAARAGVLSGETAVTLGAIGQGMVAGDIVNTAARLQTLAPSGSVLVGDTTRRATASSISYEEAGEHILKGKAVPIAAWHALRVVAEIGGKNRAVTMEAPFVGRDDQVRLLKDLFHASGREGRARILSIVAPAAMGKSRLAWEFSKYVDGLVESVWWHAGRSPAYGEGITFWALGEMVRERAGLAETDDEATVRGAIRRTVDEWIADTTERRWVESALLALLGIEPITGGSEQLFGAWRTFFTRIAERGTVVLLFEDLHWADPGTLAFIDHLLDWARNAPLFIITLARPELVDKRPDWGVGGRNFVSIALDPLDDGSMSALLDGLVNGLPDDARRRIVTRAEGVPLYAVEIVRMLVADGALTQSGGGLVVDPSADLRAFSIPETLTALIAARLDALDAADRGVVGVAAVLGQSFTPAALAAVAGLSQPELTHRLRSLVRREILGLAADPKSPERGQYVFVQAMIREIAYNTLAKRDRRSRHLAAARYFETLESDELAAAVAGHLLAAHRTSAPGAEADAVAHQARIALQAAAVRAAQLGAPDQAVAFVEQALTVATDPADEIDLLELAGRASIDAGRYERAEAFLRRAIERDVQAQAARRHARLHALLGDALLAAYQVDDAIGILTAAGAADDASTPDSADDLALAARLARAWLLAGESAKAIAAVERALPGAERLDDVELVADLLTTRGSALGDMGRQYEGTGLLRAALELARTHDLHTVALRAINNLLVTAIGLDPVGAVAMTRDAMDDSLRLGSRMWASNAVTNGAEAALWTGDWEWALREADELLASELHPSDRGSLLCVTTQIRAFQGHPDPMATHQEIQALLGETLDLNIEGVVRGMTSHVAFATGDLALARSEALRRGRGLSINAVLSFTLAARAATWLRDEGAVREDLRSLRDSARGLTVPAHVITIEAALAGLAGRTDAALADYRRALQAWRDLGLPVYVAFTALDMATVLGPDGVEVQEALVEAREILVGLEAAPFVARVDALLAPRSDPADVTPPAQGRQRPPIRGAASAAPL